MSPADDRLSSSMSRNGGASGSNAAGVLIVSKTIFSLSASIPKGIAPAASNSPGNSGGLLLTTDSSSASILGLGLIGAAKNGGLSELRISTEGGAGRGVTRGGASGRDGRPNPRSKAISAMASGVSMGMPSMVIDVSPPDGLGGGTPSTESRDEGGSSGRSARISSSSMASSSGTTDGGSSGLESRALGGLRSRPGIPNTVPVVRAPGSAPPQWTQCSLAGGDASPHLGQLLIDRDLPERGHG